MSFAFVIIKGKKKAADFDRILIVLSAAGDAFFLVGMKPFVTPALSDVSSFSAQQFPKAPLEFLLFQPSALGV